MKLLLKALISIIVISVSAIAIKLYWNRDVAINFSELMPKEFFYCGENIGPNSKEYIHMKKWFEANQTKWKYTPLNNIQRNTFKSPTMTINVFLESISVIYPDKNGAWREASRESKLDEFVLTCQNSEN